MKKTVIIGAGSGGLVIAIGLARAKRDVTLIDKGTWGGDCTNFGCIPSKSLISFGKMAHTLKHYNLQNKVDFSSHLKEVRDIRESIRNHEVPQSLEKLGIKALQSHCQFLDPNTLQLEDGTTIKADQIIIAAGSKPLLPKIEGLNEEVLLTNETIFEMESVPKKLAILGGGPIGCELAQAMSRLGSKVSILHKHATFFEKEAKLVAPILQNVFEKEGIDLYFNANTTKFIHTKSSCELFFEQDGKEKSIQADKLLVSVGRVPSVEGLSLEKAGINFSDKGIGVDSYGRTNQKHIFAVGDIVGRPFFTHLAENRARSVLTSLFLPFGLKKKLDLVQPIPRCTFTDPEVASFGLSQEEAIEKFSEKRIAVYEVPLTEVDRAICESRTEGFIQVVTKKWSSKILGATIVAPRAGEMLMQLTTAKFANMSLRKMSGLIHPYPIYNLGIRKAADKWLTQVLLKRGKG